MDEINWEDPHAKISEYFTVRDACYLPSWHILHIPSDKEKINILVQAKLMDQVRDFFNTPIIVNCWLRPILNNRSSKCHGLDYNLAVHGAPNSAHKIGNAVDFTVFGSNCDKMRQRILDAGLLETLSLRMEDLEGSNWIHLDSAEVKTDGHRFFKP